METSINQNHTLFRHMAVNTNQDVEARTETPALNERGRGPLRRLGYEVFRKDCLDRRLSRHHITGIAFSGAVGIGIFQTSGEVISLGGPVGALLAYIFASIVIFSVMRSLAEMVSVRPVTAPLIDFPHTFLDEALGFTVGIMYWLANCMSMVTLTIAAAMFTQYWPSTFRMTSAVFVCLVALYLGNACGVQLYGRMEWAFKWLKICILLGMMILMIAIKAGVGPGRVDHNFEISPGYNPTGFLAGDKAAIGGTRGRILMVWTCTTIAMFQFMGGEIVLVTSGEAKHPMRDLPIAARYMYTLPVISYLLLILLLGLNVNYLDPRIYHSHVAYLAGTRLDGIQTAARSPFVVVIQNAGIRVLPGFLDACFIFSALTAANSALYVSSRTLFTLALRSSKSWIRSTIGRTNNGHTPLAAITVSFLPGGLAFLAVRARERAFQEPIHILTKLYTGPMLCIFATECLAFLRFLSAIKFYKNTIDRDDPQYRQKHYYAHWQPLWAILGLILCTLLMFFSGWAAIYELSAKSIGVDPSDSIADLVASYLGPLIFLTIFLSYKYLKGTRVRSMDDMRDVWFVKDVPNEDTQAAVDDTPRINRWSASAPRTSKSGKAKRRCLEFLKWIR